jgi:hypothetical protein
MQLRRRSIRQFLIGSIAIFALLADVGVAGLWVRSYYAAERVLWVSEGEKRLLVFAVSRGIVESAFGRRDSDRFHGVEPRFYHISDAPRDLEAPHWQRGHFKFGSRRFGLVVSVPVDEPGEKWVCLVLPCWFLCLLASTIAAFFGRKFLRNRKLARSVGLCPHCGYDLRATPERCPECGKAVVA